MVNETGQALTSIKCLAVAFAFKAKAPKYLGCAKNIIDPAGHFISWISLNKVSRLLTVKDNALIGVLTEPTQTKVTRTKHGKPH